MKNNSLEEKRREKKAACLFLVWDIRDKIERLFYGLHSQNDDNKENAEILKVRLLLSKISLEMNNVANKIKNLNFNEDIDTQ